LKITHHVLSKKNARYRCCHECGKCSAEDSAQS
jgi:hypothetical protein